MPLAFSRIAGPVAQGRKGVPSLPALRTEPFHRASYFAASKGDAACSRSCRTCLTSTAQRTTSWPQRSSLRPVDVRQRESVLTLAATADLSGAFQGTPVPKTSILVVGGTGTLGRQVVRKAIDEGYDVRCIVRPRPIPADFLRDWGATTVQADLEDPTSLPATMVGVHTVIDCATARPEESADKVDWVGKKSLIQCAQAMGIQRYVFFSIHNCDKHPQVPLMNIKHATEQFLEVSGLDYTILRLCGFHQAIIGNYAVPILEEKPVWSSGDETKTAYLDTIDLARMTLAAIRSEAAHKATMTLAGPKAWSTNEARGQLLRGQYKVQVIELCEKLASCDAQVNSVPISVLKGARAFLRSFEWARDPADRLAFAEVLSSDMDFTSDMTETYKKLDIDPSSITTLEKYLEEYYSKILKKLKEVGASSKQTDFYV